MSRGRSGFGNKPIAAKRLRSAVIAIFARHSTRRGSSTIILTPRDRVDAATCSSGDGYETS
jgi:hypothetical protein